MSEDETVKKGDPRAAVGETPETDGKSGEGEPEAEKPAGGETTETGGKSGEGEPEAEKPAGGETPETISVEDLKNAAAATEPKSAEPDWKESYARLAADFDNFRKRTARDRDDLAKFAASEVIKDLLVTADNLALALDKAANKDDPFVVGVKMAYESFLKALADHGAKPIDSLGEPFDANFHEAIAQLPSADVEEGKIMNEVKRGWLLNGRLLRAAQVVVSAGKPAEEGGAAS